MSASTVRPTGCCRAQVYYFAPTQAFEGEQEPGRSSHKEELTLILAVGCLGSVWFASADSALQETARLHTSLEEGLSLLKEAGQSFAALLQKADADRDKDGSAEDSALRRLQQALNESRHHEKEIEKLLEDALGQLSAMQIEADTSRRRLVSLRISRSCL